MTFLDTIKANYDIKTAKGAVGFYDKCKDMNACGFGFKFPGLSELLTGVPEFLEKLERNNILLGQFNSIGYIHDARKDNGTGYIHIGISHWSDGFEFCQYREETGKIVCGHDLK